MSGVLPIVSVDQYGEITWNPLGQHAGVADLQCGERNARSLGLRLKGIAFAKMFTCAVKRAVRTCELAGFGDPAENDHDLVQWDYSQHEGLRTHEIHERRPQWRLLCDRCPEGETPYLSRPRIRLGLNAKARRFFTFVTASLSILDLTTIGRYRRSGCGTTLHTSKIGRHWSCGAPGHGNANWRRRS
jgi:hypothetical protein